MAIQTVDHVRDLARNQHISEITEQDIRHDHAIDRGQDQTPRQKGGVTAPVM